MPSWFHFRSPRPPEDPAVAPIEQMLGPSRRYEAVPDNEGPVVAHALWICACVTMDDAPTWLIHDVAGEGLMWCRVPSRTEPLDMVDARYAAGGHADPAEVLRWLQNEVSDPWGRGRLGNGGGNPGVLDAVRKRIKPD